MIFKRSFISAFGLTLFLAASAVSFAVASGAAVAADEIAAAPNAGMNQVSGECATSCFLLAYSPWSSALCSCGPAHNTPRLCPVHGR